MYDFLKTHFSKELRHAKRIWAKSFNLAPALTFMIAIIPFILGIFIGATLSSSTVNNSIQNNIAAPATAAHENSTAQSAKSLTKNNPNGAHVNLENVGVYGPQTIYKGGPNDTINAKNIEHYTSQESPAASFDTASGCSCDNSDTIRTDK